MGERWKVQNKVGGTLFLFSGYSYINDRFSNFIEMDFRLITGKLGAEIFIKHSWPGFNEWNWSCTVLVSICRTVEWFNHMISYSEYRLIWNFRNSLHSSILWKKNTAIYLFMFPPPQVLLWPFLYQMISSTQLLLPSTVLLFDKVSWRITFICPSYIFHLCMRQSIYSCYTLHVHSFVIPFF